MTAASLRSALEYAEAVVDDLTNRKGLRHEWDNIDPRIQQEILDEWASHFEQAQRKAIETCERIALAINSGRGNESEIARAIIALLPSGDTAKESNRD